MKMSIVFPHFTQNFLLLFLNKTKKFAGNKIYNFWRSIKENQEKLVPNIGA